MVKSKMWRALMTKAKIEIALCDDEMIMLEINYKKCKQIMRLLNIDNYSISLFNNPLNLLKEKKRYHIYLFDVDMPNIDGFKLGRQLKTMYGNALIIYLTSHDEWIKEAFKVNAFRYLYKPINDSELYEALKHAIEQVTRIDNIIVKVNGKSIILPIDSIYYIESMGDGCNIASRDNNYLDMRPLKYWLDEFIKKSFIQTHRSFLANMKYIIDVGNKNITLSNRKQIPLSVRRYKYALESIHKYAKKSRQG